MNKQTKAVNKYTKDLLKEIKAERRYWEKYGKLIGAKLSAWTYRSSANFFIPKKDEEPYTETFSMNSYHAKMIDAAIKKANKSLINKLSVKIVKKGK